MGKKLLILDIDETIVSSSYTGSGDFRVYFCCFGKKFIKEWSLRYSKCPYDLAVWTSSSIDYATGVIKEIVKYPLKFLWTESRCTSRINMETGERFHVKNLKKVKES